jgi:predicted AAA+ superfamily ATPase
VGKTTLLRTLLPDLPYVAFDPVTDVENARADPDLFLDNRRPPVILDEVQYAPEVVAAIKRRVDRGRAPGQYFLTGSQQWGVLKNLAESMAGRASFIDLDGFCLQELRGRGDAKRSWLAEWLDSGGRWPIADLSRLPEGKPLFEQLWYGFLPGVQELPSSIVGNFHEGYRRTYIERDVRLVADVSDFQLFGRFVRLVAALSAAEVNYSELGRELAITGQTAHRWLDAMRATYQWYELPAFSANAIKRISQKPKGYVADTGAACAAQVISSPATLAGHPLLGALFETAVVGEIRKLTAAMATRPGMYHWRSHAGAEVDIVLEYNGVHFPIEVKANSAPRRTSVRGVRAFRETYPTLRTAPGLVIAPSTTPYPLTEDCFVIPWDACVG